MEKRIKVILYLLIFTMILTGCSSIEYIWVKPVYYIIPEIGIETTAFIGDSIVKEGNTVILDVITLYSSFGLEMMTSRHPKGKYILIGKKKDSKVYEYQEIDGIEQTSYPKLYEDENGTVYYKSPIGRQVLRDTDYKKGSVIKDNPETFEQTLIFTGSEGNILKFTYREFFGDQARPAYTIDATYDFSKDNKIRFKGALIEVIHFDNQSLTYNILSGFKR